MATHPLTTSDRAVKDQSERPALTPEVDTVVKSGGIGMVAKHLPTTSDSAVKDQTARPAYGPPSGRGRSPGRSASRDYRTRTRDHISGPPPRAGSAPVSKRTRSRDNQTSLPPSAVKHITTARQAACDKRVRSQDRIRKAEVESPVTMTATSVTAAAQESTAMRAMTVLTN